jgi:hypothetical protein
MADGEGNLSEIDSRNIIIAKLEELSEESQKAIEEFQKTLHERRKAFKEELKVVEEKEMQALLSCFKKDQQGGVTQIQGAILPSIESKSIKIPEITLNITAPPITSSVLFGEEVTHMVDQAVSASLANRLQKIIDGSIDRRLESALDSKVHSTMLHVNDETSKKQIEFAEPNATPIKPSFFYNNFQDSHNYSNSAEISSILGAPNQARTSGAATSAPPSRSAYAYSTPNFKPNSSSTQDPPRYSIEHVHEQLSKMLHEHYGIEPTVQTRAYHKPYPEIYDSYPYPPEFRVPKFVKFTGVDSRTTWEHVSQFLA